MTTVIQTFREKIADYQLTKLDTIQKGLLGLNVAFVALSLIPPLRFAGSLSVRATLLLSSATNTAKRWQDENLADRTLKCAQVAAVALSLAALAAMQQMLMIASFAAEIGINVLEIIKTTFTNCRGRELEECYSKRGCIIIIDALVIAARTIGSFKIMIVAYCVDAVAMIIFAKISQSHHHHFEEYCYLALAVLDVATAFSIAQYTKTEITNPYKEDTIFKDWYDKEIDSVKAGETIETFSAFKIYA